MEQSRNVTVELTQDDIFLIMRGMMELHENILDDAKYTPQSRSDREAQSQRALELSQRFCLEFNEIQPDDGWWEESYGKPVTKLAFWMEQKDISQQQLAESTGLLQPAISRFCSGTRTIALARVETAYKIARALDKQIEELID